MVKTVCMQITITHLHGANKTMTNDMFSSMNYAVETIVDAAYPQCSTNCNVGLTSLQRSSFTTFIENHRADNLFVYHLSLRNLTTSTKPFINKRSHIGEKLWYRM